MAAAEGKIADAVAADVQERYEQGRLRVLFDHNMCSRGFSVQHMGIISILDRRWKASAIANYEQAIVRCLRQARPEVMRKIWRFYPAVEE